MSNIALQLQLYRGVGRVSYGLKSNRKTQLESFISVCSQTESPMQLVLVSKQGKFCFLAIKLRRRPMERKIS